MVTEILGSTVFTVLGVNVVRNIATLVEILGSYPKKLGYIYKLLSHIERGKNRFFEEL